MTAPGGMATLSRVPGNGPHLGHEEVCWHELRLGNIVSPLSNMIWTCNGSIRKKWEKELLWTCYIVWKIVFLWETIKKFFIWLFGFYNKNTTEITYDERIDSWIQHCDKSMKIFCVPVFLHCSTLNLSILLRRLYAGTKFTFIKTERPRQCWGLSVQESLGFRWTTNILVLNLFK